MVRATMNDLGNLLVQLHILTPEQLETANPMRSLAGDDKPLQEVLIEQNLITQESLYHALEICGAISDGKIVRKAAGAGRSDTEESGSYSRPSIAGPGSPPRAEGDEIPHERSSSTISSST